MQKLGDILKNSMRKSGALATNEAGQDVLRGLTYTETAFVLDIESGAHSDGLAEIMLYNHLLVRHMAAKLIYKAAQPACN